MASRDEFFADAAEFFGLDQQEAGDLAEALFEEYPIDFDNGEWPDLLEYGPEAVDLIDFGEEESEYELDPYFEDDDWLDPGDEWEITAEYEG